MVRVAILLHAERALALFRLENDARWEDGMVKNRGTVLTLFKKYCGPAILAGAALLLVGNVTWADGNGQGNNGNGNGNKGNEAGDDRAVRLIDIVAIPGRTGVNATNGK